MKLSSYNPQVNLGRQSANVNYNPVAAAYGADQSGARALANGLDKAVATIDRIEEQHMVAKVTEANTEYNKRMSALQNELLQTQLDGAAGIGKTYEEKERQIRQEVLADKGLKYQRAVDAFNGMAEKDSTSRMTSLQRHEASETDKYNQVVVTDAVQQLSQQTRGMYNSAEAMDNAIAKATTLSDAYAVGKGEKYADMYRKNNVSSLVMGWVGDATANGDNAAVANIVDRYGKYIPTDKYNSIMNVVNTKQKSTYVNMMGDKLYSQYGNNVAAAYEAAMGQEGYTVPANKVEQGNRAQLNLSDYVTLNNDSIDLGSLSKPFSSGMAAMAADFESAFPGRKLNVTCGSEGQHVEGSDHYVGNAADIASDSMDDDIAERNWVKSNAAKYGMAVYDEYENDSPYKTGGHLHVYLDDEDAALGVSKDAPAQTERHIQLSHEDKMAIFNSYRQAVSRAQFMENQNKKAMTEQYVSQYAGSGMTATEIFNEASQGITDMNTLQAIKTAANIVGVHAATGSASRSLMNADIANIANDMKAGKIKSLDMIIDAAVAAGVTKESELNKIRKTWDDYIDGKGYFDKTDEINSVINGITAPMPSGERAKAKRELNAYAYSYIQQYQQEHNGDAPNELELRDALLQARVQKPLDSYYPGNGWMSKDLNISTAQIYALGYAGIETKDTPGSGLGYNEYKLLRKDGSYLYVTGQQLDELLGNVLSEAPTDNGEQ